MCFLVHQEQTIHILYNLYRGIKVFLTDVLYIEAFRCPHCTVFQIFKHTSHVVGNRGYRHSSWTLSFLWKVSAHYSVYFVVEKVLGFVMFFVLFLLSVFLPILQLQICPFVSITTTRLFKDEGPGLSKTLLWTWSDRCPETRIQIWHVCNM